MNVRKSLVLSFADRYSRMLLQLITTMVLSRLLTPHDIGVATIAMAVVAITHVVRDFGVGNYLLQERELTEARLRTTFGIILVTSWSMGCALVAAGPAVARIYAEPGIESVMLILALNFAVIPFGSLALIILRRDGHFGALYRISLANGIASAVVGLLLAWHGWRYLSLAWASVAGNLATVLMAYLSMPNHIRLTPSFSEWRRITKFGVLTVAANLIGQIGARASDLAVGRIIGITETGLYSKAGSIGSMFNDNVLTAILGVAVPKFAADHRSDNELRTNFLRYMALITVFAWPFFAFAGITMPYTVAFLFGDQWAAAVPIGRILCIGNLVGMLGVLNWAIIIATGAVRENLSMQIRVQGVNVGLILIGCLGGLNGVAVAADVITLIGVIISYSYMSRLIRVSLLDVLRATRSSLAVALVSAIPPSVIYLAIGDHHNHTFVILCLSGSAMCIAWLIAVFALKHPVKTELMAAAEVAWQRFSIWRSSPRWTTSRRG